MPDDLDNDLTAVLEKSGLEVNKVEANGQPIEKESKDTQPSTEAETPKSETTEETAKSSTEEAPATSETEVKDDAGNTTQESEAKAEEKEGETIEVINKPKEQAETSSEGGAETKQVSVSEITNGRFESADTLNATLEDYDKLKERVEYYEKGDGKPKFHNEMSEKFNEHVAKGLDPESFLKVQNVKLDELDDKKVLELQLQWKDGFTEAEAKSYVERKYKLDADKYGEDEYEVGKMDLARDARLGRATLKEHQFESAKPAQPYDQKAVEKAQKERMDNLLPVLDEAVESFKEGGLLLPFKDKNVRYNVDIPKEMITEMEDIIAATEGNHTKEEIRESLQNLYVARYLDTILKSYSDYVRSEYEETTHKEIHNPSAIKKGDTPNKVGTEGRSVEQQIADIHT